MHKKRIISERCTNKGRGNGWQPLPLPLYITIKQPITHLQMRDKRYFAFFIFWSKKYEILPGIH